ncbi:MAG TPA: hypothetical protein GXX36_02915 [Clostridiaceae bacterium]|nr:hypothetical protein [Clostridiaceae bacterium]
MYKKIIYKKAYRILNTSTPLNYDCGILCQNKCCKGDNNKGMILFPGEEIMYANKLFESKSFLAIEEKGFCNSKVLFATCRGKCDRNLRPLSCRIFPLVPYINKDGFLRIINDPRARYLCPLLTGIGQIKISPFFKRDVRKVFQLLSQDCDIREFLIKLSGVLEEYMRFTGTGIDTL